MQIKKHQIKTSELETRNTTERDGFELVLKISRYLLKVSTKLRRSQIAK